MVHRKTWMMKGQKVFLCMQLKVALCTVLLMLKKAKNKDVAVGKLHEVYKNICRKQNLLATDQVEFVDLCSLIETNGIVRVVGKKESRLYKVTLEWNIRLN